MKRQVFSPSSRVLIKESELNNLYYWMCCIAQRALLLGHGPLWKTWVDSGKH